MVRFQIFMSHYSYYFDLELLRGFIIFWQLLLDFFFVCVYVLDILQFISLKLLSDSLTRFDNERVLSLIALSDSLSYVFLQSKDFYKCFTNLNCYFNFNITFKETITV